MSTCQKEKNPVVFQTSSNGHGVTKARVSVSWNFVLSYSTRILFWVADISLDTVKNGTHMPVFILFCHVVFSHERLEGSQKSEKRQKQKWDV